eukprot:6964142-Pyramimonas_sp.AAC.1
MRGRMMGRRRTRRRMGMRRMRRTKRRKRRGRQGNKRLARIFMHVCIGHCAPKQTAADGG